MAVCEVRMTHFLIVGFISGLFAFWLTGWVYRDNQKLRWFWFFVVRMVILVIAYLPRR
jgi:hypothetical protein